jgi:hypothetical protein
VTGHLQFRDMLVSVLSSLVLLLLYMGKVYDQLMLSNYFIYNAMYKSTCHNSSMQLHVCVCVRVCAYVHAYVCVCARAWLEKHLKQHSHIIVVSLNR